MMFSQLCVFVPLWFERVCGSKELAHIEWLRVLIVSPDLPIVATVSRQWK